MTTCWIIKDGKPEEVLQKKAELLGYGYFLTKEDCETYIQKMWVLPKK